MSEQNSDSTTAPPPADTATSLLWRSRQGDADAARQVYFLYQPLIFRWCRLKGLVAAEIDEVAKQVLLAVSRGMGEFDPARTSSFRRWMRQLTLHQIAERVRQRPKEGVRGEAAPNPQAEAASADETACDDTAERQIVLRQAAKMLELEFSFPTWQAFYRSEVEQQDIAVICQELGLSPAAFRVAKSRVRMRLREVMDGLLS